VKGEWHDKEQIANLFIRTAFLDTGRNSDGWWSPNGGGPL